MILIFFLFAITLTTTHTCFIKKAPPPPQDLINPGEWNNENNERIIDNSCECGQHKHNETGLDPPWNLFISHANPLNITETVCVGTIITSNLIATVLQCVMLENATLNVFDIWMKKPFGIIDKSDLIVSTVSSGEGRRFTVDEIIISEATLQHVRLSKKTKKAVHNDLILLKIRNEFLGNFHLRPICIPRNNKLDFIGRLATYFGTGLGQHPSTFNSDFHYGIINTNRVCEKHTDINKTDSTNEPFLSLCVRWGMSEAIEENEFFKGGSLFIHSIQDGRAFLVGINREVEKNYNWQLNGLSHFMFAQFTNILPFIKYIEYKAKQHKSKWCRMKTGLVLPEKVKNVNYAQLPFEGKPSKEMGKKSWLCAEDKDILNETTETDWSRFAEGQSIVRKEILRCNEQSNDPDVIQFFQKDKKDPNGQASLEGLSTCTEIPNEMVLTADFIASTKSIYLVDKCDGHEYIIKLNGGEKLNLEWFGLAKRLIAYKPYDDHSSAKNVIFYSSSGHDLNSYNPYELCACNNLNPKLGIPSKVTNIHTCLELYAEKDCKNWIRTIPAGKTLHSDNLMANGKISYPKAKSFKRCAVLPNCYKLDVSVVKAIFKNKGRSDIDGNIQYKEYPIVSKTIVNERDGEKTYNLERDLNGFTTIVKIQLPKSLAITQIGDNPPKLEMKDGMKSTIPHLSMKKLHPLFRVAYDEYFHVYQKEKEQKEFTREFFPFNENAMEEVKYLPVTLKGNVTATIYEYILVAREIDFSYDIVLKIRGSLANGERIGKEMLREKVASDLGYKEEDKCKGENKKYCYWGEYSVRFREEVNLKLTVTIVDYIKRNKNVCQKDKAKCANNNCKCDLTGGYWSVPGDYWW